MKALSLLLLLLVANVQSFWDGKNPNFAPFGSGTGYNSTTPWSVNSNWNPFVTNGKWGPENDAANLSRYGARPQALMQYKKNPRFMPVYPTPISESRIKPSNWLTDTDFASTMQGFKAQANNFIVDELSPFSNSTYYAPAKAETFDLDRALRDRAPYKKHTIGNTDNIYGKQGYSLSPAASSTQQIDNK